MEQGKRGRFAFGYVLSGEFDVIFEIYVVIFEVYSCNLFEECSERLSPGESWAGGPPNPLVHLRGRWGCQLLICVLLYGFDT